MDLPSFFLVNGEHKHNVSINDRGLLYGDGVFRTTAVVDGRIKYQDQQLAKLFNDCSRLLIPIPQSKLLLREIALLCSELVTERAVLKIIITRGISDRGYRINPQAESTRILAIYSWPNDPESYRQQGVNVRICTTKLGHNPQLAGIKHLNRLEQVLARNEWQGESFQEGILCDHVNNVISGISSNLFMVKDNTLLTPCLDNCGVAGVTRGIVIKLAKQNNIPCQVQSLSLAEILKADGLFITNSLIGIWPIKRVGQTSYSINAITRYLQSLI